MCGDHKVAFETLCLPVVGAQIRRLSTSKMKTESIVLTSN
jgi:hypothetical protein